MVFDALIIGGGVAGTQCALVLGSVKNKPFASKKNIGIIMHQKNSHLQNALFNNVLGLELGTLGKKYSHIHHIDDEKVTTIEDLEGNYKVLSNKNEYLTKIVVVALNYSKPFSINGLENYLIPHQKANPKKDRIQLQNKDHLIKEGLYACGTNCGLPKSVCNCSW